MILSKPNYQEAIDLIQETLDEMTLKAEQKKELLMRKAGLFAEKQMAFLLESYFDKHGNVLILNNLKIEHGTGAQIDHLVLTTQGMYLIESKSVSGALHVDEYGDWSRVYKGYKTPMKSPVNQVKRQCEILFDLMQSKKVEFRAKILGLQGQIGAYKRDCFVAVSEKGKITGKREQFKDLVVKGDHIPERIKEALPTRGLKGLVSFKDKDIKMLSQDELEKLGQLLLGEDVAKSPLEDIQALLSPWLAKAIISEEVEAVSQPIQVEEEVAQEIEVKATVQPIRVFQCKKCDSKNIVATTGRYGAYFKCSDCEGNTPIKESCPTCDEKMKVSVKDGSCTLSCKACELEELIQKDGQLVVVEESVKAVQKIPQEEGFCIRCKVDISFNIEAPYCKKCYSSWNRYKNPSYAEKYCHSSGVESTTSMAKPVS